ncbi:MAG: HEAT repeat domain-containing protein [Planctomycetota bacterium]
MKRLRWGGLAVLFGIMLWFLGEQPIEGVRPPTFSAEAIGARIDALTPYVERAIGEPFPRAVDFRIVSRPVMAKVLARETPTLFSGEQREFMERAADPMSHALSQMVFAKVELANARLNIAPRNFGSLDKLFRGDFDLTGAPFRDVVLIHELVHVHQFQAEGGARFFGDNNRGIEELNGPSSVVEGYAQYVTARVARHLDMAESFGTLEGLTTGNFPGMSERSRRVIRMSTGAMGFPYYRGLQLVERVVRQRGFEAARRELLSRPPRDQFEVTVPQRYLPPDEDAKRFDTALQRVERYLEEVQGPTAKMRDPWTRQYWDKEGLSPAERRRRADWSEKEKFRPFVVCSVDFRLRWPAVSWGEVAERLKGFIAGVRFEDPKGDAFLGIYRCRDAAAAKRLMESIRHPDADDYLQVGPFVLDARDTKLRHAEWLRAARVLLLSAYEPAPWTGKPFAELPAIFIASSRAEDWAMRWRAVRNLGRLSDQADGVIGAVRAAVRDDDVLVRLAALHALLQWDRLDELDAETWDALGTDKDRRIRDFERHLRPD